MKKIFTVCILLSLILFSGCLSEEKAAEAAAEIKWTQVTGSDQNDIANDSAIVGSQYIYITGVTLGSLYPDASSGSWDIFLGKYDSTGKQRWLRQYGSNGRDEGKGIAVDQSGDIYVTGRTSGSLDGEFFYGDADIFLTKFNPSGTIQWTRQWGTKAFDCGEAIASDNTGNLLVTGYTQGGLNGNTNKGEADIFLTKLNSKGELLWITQWGTEKPEWGFSVTSDGAQNIYVCGWTSGELAINGASGNSDIFLAKFSTFGELLWITQWGTENNDEGFALGIDPEGMIYVTGRVNGNLDGNKRIGFDDIFLTKFTPGGEKKWSKQWGTKASDYGQGLTVKRDGTILVTGFTFGSFKNYKNFGASDIFVTAFHSNGNHLWSGQYGTVGFDYPRVIISDTMENLYIAGDTSCDNKGNPNKNSDRDIFFTKMDSKKNK